MRREKGLGDVRRREREGEEEVLKMMGRSK